MVTYYVTDVAEMRVAAFEDLRYPHPRLFGKPGAGVGQLASPTSITLMGDQRLLVADRDNHRLVAFDAQLDGSGWETLGTAGTGLGEFNSPTGVAVDGEGRILVADTGNHRIVRVDDLSGQGWIHYGAPGKPTASDPEAIGCFAAPSGVSADERGVIVTDLEAGRAVRIGDLDRPDWEASKGRWIRGPFAVEALSTGQLAMGQLPGRVVTVHEDVSAPMAEWTGSNAVFAPTAIAELEDGEMLACDAAFGRLVRLRRGQPELSLVDELDVKPLGLPCPVGACTDLRLQR